MRKALAIVLAGLGAVTIAGAAAATSGDTHTLTVPLPDGSTANIEYVGNVAPRVTVTPAPLAPFGPSGLFDRSALDIQRDMDAMLRQISEMASRPLAAVPGLNRAAYGNAPPGSTPDSVDK